MEFTKEERKVIKKIVDNIGTDDLLTFQTLRELVMTKINNNYLKSPFILNHTVRLASTYFYRIHEIPYKRMRAKIIKKYVKENHDLPRKELAKNCGISLSTVNNILAKEKIKSNVPRSISAIETTKELKRRLKSSKYQLCAKIEIISNDPIEYSKRTGINRISLFSGNNKTVGEIQILPEFSFSSEYFDRKDLLYPNNLSPEEVKVLKERILDVNLLLAKILDSFWKGEYNECK